MRKKVIERIMKANQMYEDGLISEGECLLRMVMWAAEGYEEYQQSKGEGK